MELIQSVNLGLRFLLELCALAAFGYWGYHSTKGPLRFVLAPGLPLLVAIIWATFVAPNAVDLPQLTKLVLGLLILGFAAVGIGAAGRPTLATAFGSVIVANAALMQVWQQ